MKVFFDTEFTGLHKNTSLLSVGFISENGKEFYGALPVPPESSKSWFAREEREWINKNVINNSGRVYIFTRKLLRDSLIKYFDSFGEKVELWSDCLAYDWVLFCDLFGHAFKIPENVYYIPFDICTLFKIKGIDPDINREEFVSDFIDVSKKQKHNALWDAKVIKACYEKITWNDGKKWGI